MALFETDIRAQLQLFVASLAGGRWWLKASKQATNQQAYVRYVGIMWIHARTRGPVLDLWVDCTVCCGQHRATTTGSGSGDGGGGAAVCLEPPGSTRPDSVQIVDDTLKHSPKQVHTQRTHK